MLVNRILVWGMVASGLSAVYWWKRLNPNKSLNPTVGHERLIQSQFHASFGKDADD